MRVLVTWATKHGGTAEIGEAIAEELRAKDLEVMALPAEDAPPPDEFEAVIIGSGAYMGKWLKAALEYVGQYELALRQRPVWLFTSGPIGEPPRPEDEDAVDIAATMHATNARAHRLFPGRIDRKKLGFAERAIVMALRVPDGDWRNWDDIRAWAREIGHALAKNRAEPAPVNYCPWDVGGRW